MAPPLVPTQKTSEVSAQARVTLTEVDGDILKFSVANLGGKYLVVARDEILLSAAAGLRRRQPGGVESSYAVAPGASHKVYVRFSFNDVKVGETVNVLFDHAILVDGKPLSTPLPPISLRVEKASNTTATL